MLQSSHVQQKSAERVQGYLGRVTGLVLVPTFVAGLFGANTALPGGGSWMGFEIMLVLMLISSVAVFFVLRRIDSGGVSSSVASKSRRARELRRQI